jgi:hypothetical protein
MYHNGTTWVGYADPSAFPNSDPSGPIVSVIEPTTQRTIYFPNKSGTIALLDDVGTGGSGGLFEPDGNGDLMPNDAIVEDSYYELDGNGDIQPL